jgi:eukaryotic-like serine/threonine-protein kinase
LSGEADSRSRERVGSVLSDKWTLEKLLGVGGMGAVYAAKHRNGARAAVKVLHPDLARNKEVRERFLREGYAANTVEHRGAVKVLDDDVVTSGPDEGTAYLVMELLEGESLEDRIERGDKVGEREFLGIAASVLEVLEAAHSRGIVHRDLKPENLFLAREEDGQTRVKVLDFGLARVPLGHSTTTYGMALGTPSFMSPEQASGKNDEIDGRTDLFSLAASGYRLVTGRRIHDGGSPVELVGKMANLPAPKIRTVDPNVSEPFARVIDRALEFRREDRYPNAAEMRSDVEKAIAELDAPSGRAPPPAPSSEPQALELESTVLEPEASSSQVEPSLAPAPRKRGSFLSTVVVLAALVAIGKIAFDARARLFGTVESALGASSASGEGSSASAPAVSTPPASSSVAAHVPEKPDAAVPAALAVVEAGASPQALDAGSAGMADADTDDADDDEGDDEDDAAAPDAAADASPAAQPHYAPQPAPRHPKPVPRKPVHHGTHKHANR